MFMIYSNFVSILVWASSRLLSSGESNKGVMEKQGFWYKHEIYRYSRVKVQPYKTFVSDQMIVKLFKFSEK
jgi:hypothetical protein